MGKLRTEAYQMASKKLPEAFDGVRIAYLTDLHSITFGRDNKELLLEIKAAKPDYIFLGGDMIVGSRDFNPEVSLHLSRSLAADYPVYMGMGNHEQKLMTYEETRDSSYPAYMEELKRLDITVLDNESILLKRQADHIRLYGLTMDYVYYGKVWKRVKMNPSYIKKQLGEASSDEFSILLAHSPKYFKAYAAWGADLVLSGHVHGGIMILPGLGGVIAPDYALFPKYDSGCFKEKNSQMVLSRGLGSHTIHLRIFNPPELSVVTLKKTC